MFTASLEEDNTTTKNKISYKKSPSGCGLHDLNFPVRENRILK